jgi:N-acetylglucosaminyl-diphospho-decaprenol L-rhamnosyltransferase
VPQNNTISISIISHNQGSLLADLLADLEKCCTAQIEVLLTLNVEEELSFSLERFRFPVCLIRNSRAKGFGANHNAAFARASGGFFCALNPDIRLMGDPFPSLVEAAGDPRIGVAAPLVLSPEGAVEDSARKFPTLFSILKKAFGAAAVPEYQIGPERFFPDWVAGMFMVFRREVYAQTGGFDERFFLYYEDVDLCARLRLAGYRVALDPTVHVVHHARRDSHIKPRHFLWHVRSMLNFFCSRVFLKTRFGRKDAEVVH